MIQTIQGNLTAGEKKFGIIASRFNEVISKSLLNGAIDCLKRHECGEENITRLFVSAPLSGARHPILIILPPKSQKESPASDWKPVCR